MQTSFINCFHVITSRIKQHILLSFSSPVCDWSVINACVCYICIQNHTISATEGVKKDTVSLQTVYVTASYFRKTYASKYRAIKVKVWFFYFFFLIWFQCVSTPVGKHMALVISCWISPVFSQYAAHTTQYVFCFFFTQSHQTHFELSFPTAQKYVSTTKKRIHDYLEH